jgi:uncharacterized protein YegJ (DUF2314 family)
MARPITRGSWIASAAAAALAPVCARAESPDRIIAVPRDDDEMNAAMARARATVDRFIGALRKPKRSQEQFSFKLPIADGDETEHFWASDVSYDGRAFHGRIGNDPEVVKNVKFGDPVRATPGQISDWMYVDDGRLVGGYTVRVLRNRLPPKERSHFDASVPFRIDPER